MLICGPITSHEMTPTYPELRPSFVDGLYSTELYIFNRRFDAKYYEINVFDKEWKPIAFATSDRIIELKYLEKKTIEVYIREADKNKVEYICTTSKLLKQDVQNTGVTSKICSKIK
jgi:hypothetical protein